MKRSHARWLVNGAQVGLVAGGVLALMHCGGGANPPAADEDTSSDAGKATSSSDGGSGVVFPDVDMTAGIVFGDNGLVDCGKQAAARTITMRNTNDAIVNYAATITVGSQYYTLSQATGGIPANGTLAITVTPGAIPSTADVTPDLFAGTLEIDYPGRGVPTQIKLHQTARGAIVNLAGGGSFDLGSVKVGQSNSVPVNLSNAGNEDVTATLTLGGSAFTIGGASTTPVVLTQGTSAATPLTLAPTAAGTLSDTLVFSFNSSAVFCKPPPTSAAVTGTGTTSVGISAGTLDFGQVNCGTTAQPQPLTISSTVAMHFTAVLKNGDTSAYTLTDSNGQTIHASDSIPVPAASSFTLNVVPNPMNQVSSTTDDAFGDTLIITTDVSGDDPHNIDLRETAKGAVLKFDLSSNTVSAPVGSNVNTNFNLINTGNVVVPYSISTSPTDTFTSTLTTGNAIIGSTSGVLISKAPTQTGSTVNGTMSVVLGSGGGVLCADLPPPVPLAITGTGSAISINPSNLNFGLIDCDGPAASPQSITLSSTVATNITLTLGGGPSSPYTLASDAANAHPIALNSSVRVTPNNPYTLYVVPKTISSPASTADDGFKDTLTLTSDIVSEPARTVALSETAHGAVYSFPGQITASKTAPVTFSVQNVGNATGNFDVATTDNALVEPTNGYSLGGGASVTYTVEAGSGGGNFYVNPDTSVDPTTKKRNFPVCGNPGVMVVSPPPN